MQQKNGRKMKRKIRRCLAVFIIVICTIWFLHAENNHLGVTTLDLQFNELPQSFSGFRIVHLSDLHNKTFGHNQERIVEIVRELDPDIIVDTGDLIDSFPRDDRPALSLMRSLVKIAPVYYVTGNHEWISGRFEPLEKQLPSIGVTVLRDEWVEISADTDDERIVLIGIDDPAAHPSLEAFKHNLTQLVDRVPDGEFTILLSHRPELFDLYGSLGLNLVLSGHAHGGQVRLPFVGGLAAPDQGIFPRYTAGVYYNNIARMIVSRGLGNSIIPQRLFNRPEVIIVTLRNHPVR